MDNYKVLGVSKDASKEEIKQAYRKLAMQFHPDKHALSPKHLKDAATLKFKQLSQAYDTLIDDRKRADYNSRRSNSTYYNNHSNCYKNNNRYHDYSRRGSNYNYGCGSGGASTNCGGRAGGFSLRMEVLFRVLASRSFLLNAAFAGALLGASVIIDSGGRTLWKMQNSGKSFEEAMDSIEKAKTLKDNM